FTRGCAAYAQLLKAASYLQSPLLLIVRLYWCWQFVGTGRAKFGDVSGFAEKFAEWGVAAPHINVLLAATAESVAGLLPCIGRAARLHNTNANRKTSSAQSPSPSRAHADKKQKTKTESQQNK